ncbi:golgin-45 isoform X2 [Ornithorhynchus anatinus]|uniref:golgin-45 isoform X2 n=1 Tax=Ornithorhynchus anatinus TaxID=9258 RepID=UPI0010A8C8C5|nr:golgin-45 isoform X2 [Ornithorhynchus anatinus]
MTSLQSVESTVQPPPAPVRGAGDGMETEPPPKCVETPSGIQPPGRPGPRSPRKKGEPPPPPPPPPLGPGVLRLGQAPAHKAVEVEAVRIVVPRAAVTHEIPSRNGKVAKPLGHHKGDFLGPSEGVVDPRKELQELKCAVEKLRNSEKRLLQDKEGLSNQLHVQTEVNRELKKLLVASVGDDAQYHFERVAREKNRLILENEALGRNTAQLLEQLERMSIQCDVWRSKFLASRVMADELTNARAVLQRQIREAQSAIQDLLSEREQFRQEMISTQKLLEELLVSLQWGREQTYYPNARLHSTAELVATNHKLAKAVNSHLLGNVGTKIPKKTPQPVEFCSTPAEKMAETVLRVLDPVTASKGLSEEPFSKSTPATFLASKKNIGRFHPFTRYENLTFNCCNHCQGELIAL